jgi:hypothetical protein
MKVIHIQEVGYDYCLSVTIEQGTETSRCSGREQLTAALHQLGVSSVGVFQIFRQLEESKTAEWHVSPPR